MIMAIVEVHSRSPEDTFRLGEQWAREAQPGWVIGLTGELGAGKSQLVRGLAHGLGIPGRIQSPTFTLVHEYRSGRLPLYHLDLYRLDSPSQIIGAGLEQYFYSTDGVTVIEWVERWLAAPPNVRYRHVRIDSIKETQRLITYEDFGA
jgi:tRNA threonylcarbamoyladenosine biosynthesis protein TsaE